MICVKFGKALSGRLEEFSFGDGSTVKDLLQAAGYTLSSNERVIEKNAGGVELGDELIDGGIYVITAAVKGA